jgi:hypothetical protein|tara:strand:- start:5463 stop:7070 length:1608 start_codon:yes stop_codon:yes gene_type:complete
MPETVSYGSYTFPAPAPLIGESSDMVYVAGKVDHFLNSVSVVGNLTGQNLSGLDLQKMQMVSGMLSEFETLSISNDTETKEFPQSKAVSISFSDSNLTTVSPYSVSFECYSSGLFSEFFGIIDPTDTWSFSEQENKITKATHSVSAQGVTGHNKAALVNARDFVTGRMTGFANLSLFQTGVDNVYPFLTSRTEDINKFSNSYSLTEEYDYSTSKNPISNSGVVTTDTSISFDKEGGLSVKVGGSIYGSIDANIKGGLLTTGDFTASQAQEVAVNAVVSSVSDFESGSYTFVNRAPTSYEYTINTGENRIDFSFDFSDPDNIDQVGNVLHKQSAAISASKDKANLGINVNGEFKYNAPFDIMGTGDPVLSSRFQQVQEVFSGFATGSGFLNLAVEALRDFRADATGWHISGDYVNPVPLSKQITKNPSQSLISYAVGFDNRIDLSSGTLSGLKVDISDKKPIELSGIVPSLAGYAKQKLSNRTLGEYRVNASCEATTGQLETLEQVVSGYITGIFDIAKSDSTSDKTISFSLSRYY